MMLLKHRKYKRIFILLADVLLIFFSFLMANMLLHEFRVPLIDQGTFSFYGIVIPLSYVLIFYAFGL